MSLRITIGAGDSNNPTSVTLERDGYGSSAILTVVDETGREVHVSLKALHLRDLREAIDAMNLIPFERIGDRD